MSKWAQMTKYAEDKNRCFEKAINLLSRGFLIGLNNYGDADRIQRMVSECEYLTQNAQELSLQKILGYYSLLTNVPNSIKNTDMRGEVITRSYECITIYRKEQNLEYWD